MMSMPLRPRVGYPAYDGAFPQPATGLASTEEESRLAEVDQQTGRKLLLIGGAVSAVGGLLQMQVKVKDRNESRSRKLSKLAMLAGTGAIAWAMFDSGNREYLQSHLAVAPSVEGLGSDLDELAAKEQALEQMKKERIRQRMILSGVGLGPMAKPLHIQKVIKDLDPKIGQSLATAQTTKLQAQSAQALQTQRASFGAKPLEVNLDKAKKISMVPAVVGGAALIVGLALAAN